MSKILSLLFGKSSESRALISTSESLSSVSELDDEGEDCVSLESLEQGQGKVCGNIYYPNAPSYSQIHQFYI